ncbi:hypothetical protein BpHYR1_029633 [Brachionus plicatilis]|uniref:Uncharacterized protein n=1 Tax=Brachionus plicatilis TaxID=10195 RepID=A0A3M7RBT4_BRAPC|nr:hypothetical protein BpHYR1_029633 [Brachionus plicatilis]
MQNMEFNYQSEEMLNSAFIDPSDLKYSQDTSFDFNLSNCYLDPSCDENSLETPVHRFVYRGFSPCNQSPQSFKSNVLSDLDCQEFNLPDSCLLYTSQENIDSDLTRTAFGNSIQNEKLKELEISNLAQKKTDSCAKTNCKDVINYLIKPFSNKIIKKINKKFKKPIVQDDDKAHAKIPIQLYSSRKSKDTNVYTKCDPKIDDIFIPKISHSNRFLMCQSTENKFVDCGDLVTYYV